MCDCWGKHQSCSHRSGDGGVRPHIWVRWRMWVQSSTAYASMSALLDSLSALSMWLQQQFVQLHLSELCVCGRTCVCVCRCVCRCVCTYYSICWLFLGLGRETLHSCGGGMWIFTSCFACWSWAKRGGGRGVSGGFLKILSEALNAHVVTT